VTACANPFVSSPLASVAHRPVVEAGTRLGAGDCAAYRITTAHGRNPPECPPVRRRGRGVSVPASRRHGYRDDAGLSVVQPRGRSRHGGTWRQGGVWIHSPPPQTLWTLAFVFLIRAMVRYRVTSSRAVRKNHFPSDLVYARTRRPTLRLITCDGPFNSSTRHYRDNYIVFATIAEHA
jgi:hypothetical protein